MSEIERPRPLLERIDSLEGSRQDLELRLDDARQTGQPKLLNMTSSELREFARQWRTDLTCGTMEKRKAIFRQIVENATFDGEELVIRPNCEALTGVKVASPRGVEPLLLG